MRLGIYGDRDVTKVFMALGFEILDDVENLDDFALVLVTQTEHKLVEEKLQPYTDRPYPIVLTIPDGREKEGESLKKIIKNMERAVGGGKL